MAQSFETTIGNLTSGITGSVGNVDTRIGTVLRDGILAPTAFEFTNVYANEDTVSANQGINTAAQQSDASLENLGSNFGISRFVGSYSGTTVRFFRYTQPTTNIQIPVGTKVYTELSSVRVSFSTLATVYLTPTSPTDPDTGAYYVDCSVVCDDSGEIGNVMAGGISYTEVVGIDYVSNLTEATGGKATQTNEELVSTIASTARGNSGTKTGYEALVRTNFAVSDVKIIAGSDPDAVRAQYGGSIDIIILDENKTAMTESFVFVDALTTTELLPTFKPLISVTQITGTGTDTSSIVLLEGTDYDVIYDTYSINRRSTQEQSKILLHYSSAAHGGVALQDASILTVEYLYAASIANIQSLVTQEKYYVFGSDVLVKLGIVVPVNVTANLRIFPGYNATTVTTNVTTALTTYFNALLLDNDIQASDVISVIAGVAGVDSVDIPTFSVARVSQPGIPLQEVLVNKQEYTRMANAFIQVIG